MKNIKILFFSFLALAIFTSCENTINEPAVDELVPVEKGRRLGSNKILIQTFLTTSACEGVIPDPGCVCQEGSKNPFQLGPKDILFNFCISGPIGSSIPYTLDGDESYITLENGDQYFLEGSGAVIFAPENKKYDAFFKDEFSFHKAIINGVQKQVSGFLKTNSKVYNLGTADEYTEHNLHGFIQL